MPAIIIGLSVFGSRNQAKDHGLRTSELFSKICNLKTARSRRPGGVLQSCTENPIRRTWAGGADGPHRAGGHAQGSGKPLTS